MVTFATIGTIASIGGITTTAFAQVCTNDMQACNKGSPREEPGKPNIPAVGVKYQADLHRQDKWDNTYQTQYQAMKSR